MRARSAGARAGTGSTRGGSGTEPAYPPCLPAGSRTEKSSAGQKSAVASSQAPLSPQMRAMVGGMRSYRVTEAARLLGVSDDTVRRWIDHGILPTTGVSPVEIPGDALAARAVELAHAAADPADVLSSARNRFVGLVTRVQQDGVMAQVDIQSGPHRVVSLMSSEAVRDLGLEPGALAVAVIKATTVLVETPRER